MNNEVKLSFWEILLSPFISMKNMVTSKSDVDTDFELSENSTNEIEAELAKSLEGIDNKVEKFGNSGKAQRREVLKAVKVEQKDLKPKEEAKKIESKQEKQQIEDDRSR